MDLTNKATMAAKLREFSKDIDGAIQRAGGKVSPVTRGMGKRVVLDAFKTFDPKKAQLNTWVNTQLKRLTRTVRNARFTVKIPEASSARAMDVRNFVAETEAETGYPPSDLEIADKLHVPVRHVSRLRHSQTPEVVSGDMDMAESDGDDTQSMIREMVFDSLPDRDRVIMQHTLGMGGAPLLPGKEIARQLKISPPAVSQRVSHIRQLVDETEEAFA